LGISTLTGLSPKGASMVEVPPTAYKAWLVLLNSRCGIPSSNDTRRDRIDLGRVIVRA